MGRMMSCFCVNDILIESLPSEPSGDSLLSGLPSRWRSKPSSASAMARDETTMTRSPVNGTMLAPMHSGTGANGSFLLPQPIDKAPIANPMRRRRMLPSVRLRRSIANRFHAVNKSATVVCTLLVAVAAADAHPEFAPSTVNRYVKIDLVGPDELRLAYTTMVGPAPAAAWRRAADGNANGLLDAGETQSIGARVEQAAKAGLTLVVDGTRVVPAFDAPQVGLAGNEVAPSPFSVDLVARVPLVHAAQHTIRIDDTTPEPQLGETEVRIEESPATRIIASHRGYEGTEKETHFLFKGPKFSALEDRSITIVFAAPAAPPPPPPRPRARFPWFVVPALFAGAIGLWWLRNQRRMNG